MTTTTEKMIAIPESLYAELLDYFEDRADADTDSGRMRSNTEMKIYIELINDSKPS
jgi:hypothetical protein